MINNILKVVGVEGSSNDQSANEYDGNNDIRRTTVSSTNTNTNNESSSSNNNNFASVVGGLINNFQDTIFDGSRNGLDGTSLMDASGRGGGSGRYNKHLSKGGRTYYIDGRINRRLQQSFQNKSGKNNNTLPKNRKFSGGKLPSSLNTNVYMGRKMIADVNDLYDILNDQQAYDNYDTLMEITSCAQTEAATVLSADYSSSTGGAAAAGGSSSISNSNNSNSNNKESSQEQKQNWARAKEEELVDCMLSQFPEFGTNRPTPFTMRDENDDEDDDENGNANSKGSKVNEEAKNNAAVPGSDNPYSPTQFFTNDATDIIGRFFGMPSISNNNERASTDASNKEDATQFKRTSSFGSASTLSTMTASAMGGVVGSTSSAADRSKSGNAAFADQTKNHVVLDEGVMPDGWDQDEIDLWTPKTPPVIATTTATRTQQKHVPSSIPTAVSNVKHPKVPVTASKAASQEVITLQEQQQRESVEDNWASRRRRYRERRKKRQDWDALRSQPPDQHPQVIHSTTLSSNPALQFQAQHALLSALPDRMPPPPPACSSNEMIESTQQEHSVMGGGGGGFHVIVDDGKQHWMPDNLCKHCYSCEAPFTLLRRKHHCRVCGMIFCSACSAYFVSISSADSAASDKLSAGTMRTCKMCYDHLNERGLGVIMRGDMETIAEEKKKKPPISMQRASSEMSMNRQASSISLVDKISEEVSPHSSRPLARKGSTRDVLLPLTTELESSVINTSEKTFAGFQGEEGAPTGDFQALSITKQRLDEGRRKREEQERAEAEAARIAAEEAAVLAEVERASVEGRPPSFRLKSIGSSVRQLKWKGSSSDIQMKDAEGAGKGSLINTHSDSVEVSFVDEGDVIPQRSPAEGIRAVASGMGQSNDAKKSAKIHMGTVAADYLEKLGRELLQTDAPLLLKEIKSACTGASPFIESKLTDLWVKKLMTLSTRAVYTVEPDVSGGDLLDIRPYCKLKVVTGGSVEDSAYISGVMFHKTVSHKKMAKIIPNAKIMMLSGGIEYIRTENRIASLDTLLEQEERYMEILVTKIFKLKPNILICGKSVCRKAQELLLQANIVLLQYVKPTIMTRIARQTGATVLSSIDHVMNSTILGYCKRFRLVSFRDNDVWVDNDDAVTSSSEQRSITAMLSRRIPNHERQAALAARKLGEGVLDGVDAVTLGLSKRGVVKTYVMIEGCPKELGCTVVLRGASRPALKQVKRVLRFLINASYNMKLETTYILERCCRLPPSYKIPPTPCCSSSLCVDFGKPPNNRKASWPWNGGKNDPAQRSLSGKVTPLNHQAILITSVWMTDKTQCCPAEVKGICYYSMQDVSLGQFLRDSCFNLSLKCQNPSCKKSVIDHTLSFIHNDGLITISVERMDNPIPTSSLEKQQTDLDSTPTSKVETEDYEPIASWTFCTQCDQVVTPLTFLSKQTWQWSFGKFLEVYFYNRDAIINAPGHGCACKMQTASQLFFGCGSLAARFTYERINPYSVFCRRHLPFDESFHRTQALQDLEHISLSSSSLFVKFDKQIDAISREARELFGSAINKPENLKAVLSELNLVSSEVDNATKVLQEKISSVTTKYIPSTGKKADSFLFNFPFYSRRYLYMLAAAWNERLSAAGQALTAMKKIQNAGGTSRSDAVATPNVGDAGTDDVLEKMKIIRMLQENYARNYNVSKMTMPRSNKDEGLFEGNILPDGRAAMYQEAEIDDDEFFDEDETDTQDDINFEEDVDADVLASRNRVYNPSATSFKKSSRQRPHKVPIGKRPSGLVEEQNSLAMANNYDSSDQLMESQGKSKTVTAGGAVKSALNRFFNRGGNKEDPYTVDLGFFGTGRPRLQPGIGGLVLPVFDDQPSTIIAHSLASLDYDVQFKQYLSTTSQSESRSEQSRKDIERRMLGRNKSHIKHTFRDFDKGQQLCKFVCTTFWSVQFNSVRQAFINPQISSKDSSTGTGSSKLDIEKSYIRSLATSFAWAASGGKSGASFSRTTDDRFVIKCISRTELQMFLDCAPAYFEYLSKAFFHGLPTVLCKIVGVYQLGYHNRVTGKRTMEQVAVMQNIFYGRNITKIFDLKGSLRGRFTRQGNHHDKDMKKRNPNHYSRSRSDGGPMSDSDSYSSDEDEDEDDLSISSGGGLGGDGTEKDGNDADKTKKAVVPTLLDGDFLEFTGGRPLPLTDRAKAVFHMSILNDTLFLSIINVLDYSILVGIDEEKMELVVGIIDFMRQYDILKQMERVGKSLPMVVGSEAPTIIQPPLYKARFTNAMERYFMTVPSKWTTI